MTCRVEMSPLYGTVTELSLSTCTGSQMAVAGRDECVVRVAEVLVDEVRLAVDQVLAGRKVELRDRRRLRFERDITVPRERKPARRAAQVSRCSDVESPKTAARGRSALW